MEISNRLKNSIDSEKKHNINVKETENRISQLTSEKWIFVSEHLGSPPDEAAVRTAAPIPIDAWFRGCWCIVNHVRHVEHEP